MDAKKSNGKKSTATVKDTVAMAPISLAKTPGA